MPIHDWTRVDAGLFHNFHQDWAIELVRSLNDGLLPPEFVALIEHRGVEAIPDVLTSGDHAKVAAWRRQEAEKLTQSRRPDLWAARIKPPKSKS